MKRIGFLILFLGMACTQAGAQSEVLSPIDFEKQLATIKDKQVVDVRTLEEFTNDHLEGAVMIDYYKKDFKTQVAKLDRNKPVFVYCASGGRSGSATDVLEELGFKKIYDLKGGMNAWTKSGKPVIK